MDHFRILKRAWHIVRKYRALWLIGLILVLVGGGLSAGVSNGASSGGSTPAGSSGSEYSGPGFEKPDISSPSDFERIWEQVMPFVIAIVIIIAIIFILAVVLGIAKLILRWMMQTSLIEMINQYEENETKLSFGEGFRSGWSRSSFRLFLVRLLIRIPTFLLGLLGLFVGLTFAIVIIILVVSVINMSGGGLVIAIFIGIALMFLFLAIIIPLALVGTIVRLVLSMLGEIAYRITVIEKQGAWAAIKQTVALVRRNPRPLLLQALLVLGLRIAWGVACFVANLPLIMLALFVSGLPTLALGGALALFLSPVIALIVGIFVFIIAMMVVVGLPNLALETFATVYHSTLWTLTYRELRAIDVDEDDLELIEVKAAADQTDIVASDELVEQASS